MRKTLKYFIFTIILSFSLCFNVEADCSYKERKELLNIAKQVEIQTEIKTIKSPAIVSDGVTETTIEEEKEVVFFYITGISENIYVKYYNLFYTEDMYPEEEIIVDGESEDEYFEDEEFEKEYKLEKYISFDDLEDGIFSFYDEDTSNIYNYYFEVSSKSKNCAGKLLTKKTITKPAINKYHGLGICQQDGLENYKYCDKYITEEIKMNDVEFEKKVNNYLNANKPKEIIKEKKIDAKKIIIISSGIVLTIGTISVILIIKKKKNEL